MKNTILFCIIYFVICQIALAQTTNNEKSRKTKVSIVGNQFYINGKPTFEGRYWNGYKIEGLLPNSRMVQGIFDDENPATVHKFVYPDTKVWDANRNTNEFIEAMPLWYAHGLLSFTLNMQGGSPLGYGNHGWINTAYDSLGNLKPAFMFRLEKILDNADELGMVPILGLFYFGQDENLKDEQAVKNAVVNTVNWILDRGYTNVLIEIANECENKGYEHAIIRAPNIHELIILAKSITRNGNRLLTSASIWGDILPYPNVVEVSDFVLFHGNDIKQPELIIDRVNAIRAMPVYKNTPLVNNEDDHYDFDKPMNNFVACTSVYASWGLFDFRRKNEDFEQGYQSVPVDWGITSDRKKGFFNLLKEMTGSKGISEE